LDIRVSGCGREILERGERVFWLGERKVKETKTI
jgi:hypothetical protein